MSVVVYGSANVDLVVTVDRHPAPGETVAALGAVRRQAGGKGLNQAIGSRRAGGHPTAFIGAVGADAEAELVRQTLQQAGVEAVLRRSATLATGFAIVTVDRSAENEIVVVAGANAALDGVTSAEASLLKSANVAVFQGETPQAGFRAAASIARGVGARILLNPSPVWALTDEEIALVDLLVVNETEARLVADQLGIAAGQIGVEAVWCALGSRFPAVVLTRGSRGALWGAGGGPPASVHAPAVTAVDTTGAGDTFCGVLAAALAEGRPLGDAVRDGALAASVAVSRLGAADAIPDRVAWERSSLPG